MHNSASGIPVRDIHFIKLAKWIAFIVQCEWEKFRCVTKNESFCMSLVCHKYLWIFYILHIYI